MKFRIFTLAIVGGLAAISSTSASAQATRTWVSGVGDDANPCSRTAPCKTFAGAISKTATNGEINCIDPGGFGAVTITKSITLDCTGTFGSINNAGTNGIIVNITSVSDADRTVRVRGLTINGTGTGLNGIQILDARAVHVENVVIYGQGSTGSAAVGNGIRDNRTTGVTRLYLKDVTVRRSVGSGMSLATQNTNVVVLENVSLIDNNLGLAAAAGNRITATNSAFSGNANAGVYLDTSAYFTAMSSVIANNSVGVQNNGQASLADSLVSSNNQAVVGTLTSFGNNRIVGNVNPGGTISPAGAASTDLGQQ